MEEQVFKYRLEQIELVLKEERDKRERLSEENAALKAEVEGVKTHQKSIEQKLDEQGKKLDEILKRLTEKDIQEAHIKGKFLGGWTVITIVASAAAAVGALIASILEK